eukprot:2773845-Rhodomonas_salina.4
MCFACNADRLVFSGTGGLISLMLAAGYTPRECQAIYEYGCPLIFAKDPWRVYNPLKAKFSAKVRAPGFASIDLECIPGESRAALWLVHCR